MNEQEAAAVLAAPVGMLGGWFMISKSTYVRGGELGFKGMAFYYLGRGGALGDAHPAVVSSAMTFFPAPLVEGMWREGRTVMDPSAALAAFSECCWSWGRRRFAAAPGLPRTAELLGRVIDAADGAALPLFAGWRAAPRPNDPPALVTHLLHVLREHRGGAHGLAVLASGLTPLEAAVAGTSQFYRPQSVGWAEPLPECTEDMLARKRQAEELTNRLVAPSLSVLDSDERAELVRSVNELATLAKSG